MRVLHRELLDYVSLRVQEGEQFGPAEAVAGDEGVGQGLAAEVEPARGGRVREVVPPLEGPLVAARRGGKAVGLGGQQGGVVWKKRKCSTKFVGIS